MGFKDKFKSFFDLEENESIEEAPKKSYNKYEEKQSKDNVVSLKSIQNDSKMVLCEPSTYEESQDIADHIKKGKSVVVNLQRLDHTNSRRVVDFLGGTVYALSGNIQKLGQQTFLCTPEHVNISGNISDLFDQNE
ncbi:cell division protein SepF [Halalkalibacillus sediminis]|uniref:Cell division protein SepF n=1 Tax=Halalkalibacillus sediminis TaxID=2018042 RepID=A0A2I0QW69_9BACI|nr:cell division protein SepF [Halalkalibacillus sediminis]PKR78549.1 cell division protein SepF [Halalkalibacillus sediminis]